MPRNCITRTMSNVTTFDFLAHISRHMEFSQRTFGPGPRAAGVVDHIRKELREIEAAPHDLEEWIDVLMLALDGAWRSGATPEQIVSQLVAKQTKNEGRKWPDWRTAPPGKAIEHDRSQDQAACGCYAVDQEVCQGARSIHAQHPRCVKAAAQQPAT